MVIKVLGPGCAKCKSLESKVHEVVKQNIIDAEVIKVSDLQDIMRYGILMTPGLVIDEKVIHSGSVPKNEQILQWIKEASK